MAEERARKSDSARGGHSYAKNKGLVSFPVLMTPELRDKIRLAAALTGHKSMSKFAVAALESAAEQAVQDFRRGDGRVPTPGQPVVPDSGDESELIESEAEQQDTTEEPNSEPEQEP
jgi:hypothetical protein